MKLRGYQQYEYNEGYPEVPGLVALADFFGVSWTISWAAATSGRSAADRPRKRQDPPPFGDKMERNIALKLMYVGTAYHGWQVQQNALAVQQVVQDAVERSSAAV